MDYPYLYNRGKFRGERFCNHGGETDIHTTDSDGYQAGDSDEPEKEHACCTACAANMPCEASCPDNPTHEHTHDKPSDSGEDDRAVTARDYR